MSPLSHCCVSAQWLTELNKQLGAWTSSLFILVFSKIFQGTLQNIYVQYKHFRVLQFLPSPHRHCNFLCINICWWDGGYTSSRASVLNTFFLLPASAGSCILHGLPVVGSCSSWNQQQSTNWYQLSLYVSVCIIHSPLRLQGYVQTYSF